MQDLLGRGRGLRHAGVRPHGHLHKLWKAARGVPHLQAVRRQSRQNFQSLKTTTNNNKQ